MDFSTVSDDSVTDSNPQPTNLQPPGSFNCTDPNSITLSIYEQKMLEQVTQVSRNHSFDLPKFRSFNYQILQALSDMPKKAIDETNNEILARIEDLKSFAATLPAKTLDLVAPRLDKMAKDILKIPDDSYTAAFEENLCANLEGR